MDENENKLTNEENIENPPENVADVKGSFGDTVTLNFFGRRVRISRKNWNRISLLVFCAAIIIVGVALAYFTSHDTVTNRVHSEDDINILLLEPAWDGLDVTTYTKTSTLGIDLAAEMQPDITIPKDPQVYNSSETAVYVRMKIVLYDADGDEITDVDTISALLSSLYYYDTGNSNAPVQLIPTDYISDSGSIIETDENTTTGTSTYTDYNDTMQENNSYDYDYNDGWFYYTKVLAQGERTSHLFDYIDVPVLKTEYKYFEDGFSIEIEAQAIDASAIDTSSGTSWSDILADVVAEFTRKHGE